ncbi:4-hydroxy-tetrahydrodipicolinate reductase [Oecophyllibacter saccharovorans]|uniref:4-hydroxy-tetrahydrodipicolinate reductase n=1 Tax=Oecophyllibacter saccharovorans TaxID=2558360 RepID=A0A506URV3_9PROT|nr:4-hydroxy-tetrahydrodipicolinate reductase [Oecophyllibacter saccharovorans]TPW36070.1 4-hydroxy-tetrahydrodipicolinate reductase [Oecophyllibacter saccharovorans]
MGSDSPAPVRPRIGIAGITGRLGHLCAAEAGRQVSAGLTRHPRQAGFPGIFLTSEPAELAAHADVIIDVSYAGLVQHHAASFARASVPWVLGTTGLTSADIQAVEEASRHIPVLRAANFSPALTMVLQLARQLGATLPASEYDAEIFDVHHRQKVDAPSGTALAIGQAVAEGREVAFDEVKRFDQNGARPEGAIGFAALRGGQVVGEHELRFLAADEEITLSHRALDRRVFARGALKAADWLARPGRRPGLYGMQDVLEGT